MAARSTIAARTNPASTATSAPDSHTRGSRSSTSRPASSRSPNEDDTLWIVFNGEIFNYVELRAELERLGHRFRTQSDTEVIVHAYEAWGEDAFARMNGQWAIALWDQRDAPGAVARSARHPPALPLRARRPSVLRERGEGDLRGGCRDPARVRSGGHRPDLHVLDGRPAAERFSRDRGAAPRATSASMRTAASARRRYWTPRYPTGRRAPRPVRRLARRRRRGGARRAGEGRGRCACCAPTCRSAAISPAGSTARSSRRSDGATPAAASRRSRCASTTPSTTRPPSSA